MSSFEQLWEKLKIYSRLCYNAQVTAGDCVILHKLLSVTVL